MRRELRGLAWLTVAFVGVFSTLVITIYSVIHAHAFESGLGLGLLGLGFLPLALFLLLAFFACILTALTLGIVGCRTAQQERRWGWFVTFLALRVLVPLGVLTLTLAGFGAWSLRLSDADALFLLIGPPLALVLATLLFRSAPVAAERGETFTD